MPSNLQFSASTSVISLPTAEDSQDVKSEEIRQLFVPQEGVSPEAFFGTGFGYRHDWGDRNGQWKLNLNWSAITPRSLVFVAIGEGAPGGPNGGKLIGGARYTLHNVAPANGVVSIWFNIEWGSPIRLYADYFVINP